ncbi:MAG TPA: hypothetical protein VKH82_01460 [Candidatus Binatia bacterium]|nr:hypothetical protein [Candidatus Binatia bacterium]
MTLLPTQGTAWRRAEPPYVPPPPDPKEVAAREAERARLTAAREAEDRRAAQAAAFARTRDRRPLGPIREAWRVLLLNRVSPERHPRTPACREWVDDTLIDLVAADHELRGIDPHRLGRGGLARAALERGTVGWMPIGARGGSGYQATSDFPGLLDSVVAVLYSDGFTAAPQTFRPWTRDIGLNDFRTAYLVHPGFPQLLEVPEQGEFTRAFSAGPVASITLVTFGRIVGLTREAVLANDLVGFSELVTALAAAAASLEADAVYALLATNPPLADGQPLFSAAHGNLLSPAPLTRDSLAAATAAMGAQTAASGAALHLVPRYLIVGSDLGQTARELVVPSTPPTGAEEPGALAVIVEPRITNGGWYLAASPSTIPTIATAHLTREPGPTLDVRDAWDIDAREYRARHNFGASVADYRGLTFTPAP